MNDENDGDKYLDPNLNPLLPCNDPSREKAEPDPGEWRREDGRIPVPASVEDLTAMLEGAFPDLDDVEISGHKIVKMADGSFQVDGARLGEAAPEVRLELWDAIFQAKK